MLFKARKRFLRPTHPREDLLLVWLETEYLGHLDSHLKASGKRRDAVLLFHVVLLGKAASESPTYFSLTY